MEHSRTVPGNRYATGRRNGTAEFCKQEICLRRGLAKDARELSINHSELKAQATETQATNIEKSSYCILMVCTPK